MFNNKTEYLRKSNQKIQFITYPVRLSDVLSILISALVICLKALALRALALRFWS